jgi:hypothetical protein
LACAGLLCRWSMKVLRGNFNLRPFPGPLFLPSPVRSRRCEGTLCASCSMSIPLDPAC